MNIQLEKNAIEWLRYFENEEGYRLAYSGGKDSDAILILANLANVKYEAVHNYTSIDAPETMNYIRSQNIKIEKAYDLNGNVLTMYRLIVKKGYPPTRLSRYCCDKLKERKGFGRVLITGVRWAESYRRTENSGLIKIIGKAKHTQKTAEKEGAEYKISKQGGLIMNLDNDSGRRVVEHCYRTTKTILNPIINWTDEDVWDFLKYYGCKSNPLYECGFNRIGCIGCPLAKRHQKKEFDRYPQYRKMFIKAFDDMIVARVNAGKSIQENWSNGEAVFKWWLEN